MKAAIMTVLLFPAMIGLTAPTAVAANGAGSSGGASQSSQKTALGTRQLRNFAEVRAKLNHIRNQVKAELKTRNTASRRERVFREGRKAMQKVLKKHHMTATQYRGMAVTIQDNPQLQKELEAMEPGNE